MKPTRFRLASDEWRMAIGPDGTCLTGNLPLERTFVIKSKIAADAD
jgi:hypothetical protein